MASTQKGTTPVPRIAPTPGAVNVSVWALLRPVMLLFQAAASQSSDSCCTSPSRVSLAPFALFPGRAFKYLDVNAREQAVADMVALCWRNHVQCVAAKKKVKPSSMAYYAVQGVKSGQSLSGTRLTVARQRHIFAIK